MSGCDPEDFDTITPGKEVKISSPIMQYFAYDHLPPHLREISARIGVLAHKIDQQLTEGAEKSAGLRKLLEAKDCFVRAALEK